MTKFPNRPGIRPISAAFGHFGGRSSAIGQWGEGISVDQAVFVRPDSGTSPVFDVEFPQDAAHMAPDRVHA